MPKKNGRDWTEWQKQVTGMHRLGNEWKSPRQKNHEHLEETTASMVLPREFRRDHSEDKKILKWILIFIALLFVRKVYFEMTKYEKIRKEPTYKSLSR